MKSFTKLATVFGAAIAAVIGAAPVKAADHGDAPIVAHDAGADIADVFFFLDPNDNTRVILIGTVHGFITPGEAANFGAFDDKLLYHFDIENTGDAKPDTVIEVKFSPRVGSATAAQTASIRLPGSKKFTFTAPTTPPTLDATPNAQVVSTDPASGVQFFAGEVDDPFFFDIPGFNRFVASVRAGSPNPAALTRGRDTFAGFNVLGIALSMPITLLQGKVPSNVIGVDFATLRKSESVSKNGEIKASGSFRQKDRMGNPAVNVALIPFDRKSAYNVSKPTDDAKGVFADDIIATLKTLGASDASVSALAGVAVTTGDYLHLDVTKPNTGPLGGTNPEAAFPNGRRLADDTIDIILTIIANGTPLGDNVNASDVPPQNQFPFLALPQQPREGAGNVDDNTRN